jgi:hypothetical protein
MTDYLSAILRPYVTRDYLAIVRRAEKEGGA